MTLASMALKFRAAASIWPRTRSRSEDSPTICAQALAVKSQPVKSQATTTVPRKSLLAATLMDGPALLFFNRHFVTLRMSGGVFDGLDVGNADGSGDRLDNLLQLPANILTRCSIHGRGLDLIDEPALLAGNHDHAGEMRIALDWFVLEVDEVRRNKHKEKNQRDHDVVMQAAPLIRPENISTDCAPDRAHGRDGAFERCRGFRLLPVYLGIHGISNLRLRDMGRDAVSPHIRL